MRKLLICLLALKLTASYKFNRAYLPPPGAKFSGGNPEDLQVPLEFPKETHQIETLPQTTIIEPETDPTDRKPTIGKDENFNIGKSSRNDDESKSNALDSFLNTSPIPIPFNKVIPAAYSTDDSYGISLHSTETLPRSFKNAPLQTGSTSTEESELQKSTTVFGNVPNTYNLPASGIIDQQTFSINQSPTLSEQNLLRSNSYQANDEFDLYQNQIPGNVEFNIQTGDQPILDVNQFPKHQDTAHVQNNLISATSRPENIIPDYQIGISTKDDKYSKLMEPDNQRSLLVHGQNKINESYKGYNRDFPNKTDLAPVNVKLSDDISREVSLSYLTSSAQPIVKPNIDSHKRISNRLERPQAAADRNSVILNYKNVITPEEFSYGFDTSNGIHAEESGTAVDGVKAQGAYSYTGDDGNVYSVIYTADENGFQPHGDHLPTPPPLPKYIQKLIEEVGRHKEFENSDDGSYDDAKYGYKRYQGAMDHYNPDIQGVSFKGNKFVRAQKTIHRQKIPLTKGEKLSNKYEDANENHFDGAKAEPYIYNNRRSKHPLNKSFENDNIKIPTDTSGQINAMKSIFPESKAYTKDIDQPVNKLKSTHTNPETQNNYIMQQYYNGSSDVKNNIPDDDIFSNIYSQPIVKLTNLSKYSINQDNGKLNVNYPFVFKDINSGYNYEKPEIKFSHEFTENHIITEKGNNTKYISPAKPTSDNTYNKIAATGFGGEEYTENTNEIDIAKDQGITSQDVDHNKMITTTISVYNDTPNTGVSPHLQTIATPYQQDINGRNFIQKEDLTPEQNIDNSYGENMNTSGYFFVSSTTPKSSQSVNSYSDTESKNFIRTGRPRFDYNDRIKTTEYPADTIKPSTINPPLSEVPQDFLNSIENVVVDGLGRPLPTEQPDREFTEYVYSTGYSTAFDNEDTHSNLSSTINDDDSEVSELHSVDDMENIPYEVVKNFKIQIKGLKDNQDNLEGLVEFGSPRSEVLVENQSTTERIIGEDFSGPEQPQTYDPETGYHYK